MAYEATDVEELVPTKQPFTGAVSEGKYKFDLKSILKEGIAPRYANHKKVTESMLDEDIDDLKTALKDAGLVDPKVIKSDYQGKSLIVEIQSQEEFDKNKALDAVKAWAIGTLGETTDSIADSVALYANKFCKCELMLK
jgi:hypothetical protein